jgi:hypothetical protein
MGNESKKTNPQQDLLDKSLKDNETSSENRRPGSPDSPSAKSKKITFFQRFTRPFRNSNLLNQRDKKDENAIKVIEDEQVTNRLVGEETLEVPSEKPIYKMSRKRRMTAQATQLSEPETQLGNDLPVGFDSLESKDDAEFINLRKTALEGYEPPIERDDNPTRFTFFHLREWFDQLNPKQRVIYIICVLIALGSVISLIAIGIPQLTHPIVSNSSIHIGLSPVPRSVILPNNQAFDLSVGSLENGHWTPKSAEWLDETEVPRWLSIPWSQSLASSISSLVVDQPIQLKMSNNEILLYRYSSVQEILNTEISTFHKNTADLLIVLSKPNSSTSIVIIAVP